MTRDSKFSEHKKHNLWHYFILHYSRVCYRYHHHHNHIKVSKFKSQRINQFIFHISYFQFSIPAIRSSHDIKFWATNLIWATHIDASINLTLTNKKNCKIKKEEEEERNIQICGGTSSEADSNAQRSNYPNDHED